MERGKLKRRVEKLFALMVEDTCQPNALAAYGRFYELAQTEGLTWQECAALLADQESKAPPRASAERTRPTEPTPPPPPSYNSESLMSRIKEARRHDCFLRPSEYDRLTQLFGFLDRDRGISVADVRWLDAIFLRTGV